MDEEGRTLIVDISVAAFQDGNETARTTLRLKGRRDHTATVKALLTALEPMIEGHA